MRGMVGGSATSNGGGPQPQTLQRVGNGRRLHHSQSQGIHNSTIYFFNYAKSQSVALDSVI